MRAPPGPVGIIHPAPAHRPAARPLHATKSPCVLQCFFIDYCKNIMATPEAIRDQVRRRLAEQRSLVARMLKLREQLGGSLFARYGVCGKEGCACRQGRKHGPYYVLSTRSAGRGGFAYLAPAQAAQARSLVASHRSFRAALRRLRRVNEELVGLLRRYQAVSAKQAGRRLGLPSVP